MARSLNRPQIESHIRSKATTIDGGEAHATHELVKSAIHVNTTNRWIDDLPRHDSAEEKGQALALQVIVGVSSRERNEP